MRSKPRAAAALPFVLQFPHRMSSLSCSLRSPIRDTVETVVSKMGQPQQETRTGLYLHGDSEYRYTSWPLPGLWIVSFKDGKVLEKAQR